MIFTQRSFYMQEISGVARAFPGGRLAHPEGQNEEENNLSLRKNKKKLIKIWGKLRKVGLLPTWDCEAGYGPAGDTTNKWLCQNMSTTLERCKIPTIWCKATVRTPSLTSPRTTLRATGPSHCCASHSSCLKRWSMDVSTPSLIPSYRLNKLASTKNDQP